MLFRRSGQVAVQAALLLAIERESKPQTVREMVSKLGVSAAYLAKVLQALARTGLLRSIRGPGGGFRLSRSPAEIHLWEVLDAAEHLGHLDTCLLGLGGCDGNCVCPLHKEWAPIRDQIIALLQTRSLGDLVAAGGQNLRCRFPAGAPLLKQIRPAIPKKPVEGKNPGRNHSEES